MKIALLTGTYSAFSGIDRVVEQQAKSLIKQGHMVRIIAFAADLPVPRGGELIILRSPQSPLGLRLWRLFYPLLPWRWSSDLQYLRGFQEIHVHQYPLTVLGWAAKRFFGTKYIFHDYGIPPTWSFPGLAENIYMMIFHGLSNLTIRPADQAFSISHFLQKQLAHTTGLKSTILHPIIDHSRFNQRMDGRAVRRKYNIGSAPLLLFVGRIVPYKGVHLLIEILKRVTKSFPGTKLLIVGKPTFPAYWKKLQAMTTPGVTFAGYVPDKELPQYYESCTIYITASSWEGYDLPIAEAQACGKPVVAFDIGSHREVINQKGTLVPEGNLDGFAQAIQAILAKN